MTYAAPIHIPNGKGGAYKTELALARTAEHTEKLLWWHEDDPRPDFHDHPWPFTSIILSGGYTEHRAWIDEDGKLQKDTIVYRAGDENYVPAYVYHVVIDVLPGTHTHLVCGAKVDRPWGYLDLDTLVHIPAVTSPDFLADLKSLNPHLRPTE